MIAEIIPFKEPRSLAGLAANPPAMFLPDEKAAERFFGFFTANIHNKNTRRAYYKAACRFSDWCESQGMLDMGQVKPPHIVTYIEGLTVAKPDGPGFSRLTAKVHLTVLRGLFEWLVAGHVLDVNPTHAVRVKLSQNEPIDAFNAGNPVQRYIIERLTALNRHLDVLRSEAELLIRWLDQLGCGHGEG